MFDSGEEERVGHRGSAGLHVLARYELCYCISPTILLLSYSLRVVAGQVIGSVSCTGGRG